MNKRLFPLALLGLVFFAACSDDDSEPKPALQVATTYDSTNYASNSTQGVALRNGITTLTRELQKGRQGNPVSQQAVLDAFNAGSPSVSSVTTSFYRNLIAGYALEAQKASTSGVYDATQGPAANGEGGTLGGYLFDEQGAEMEQYIEKGLYGAALYNQAVAEVQSNDFSVANVDQILALYGSNPTFPATSTSKAAKPDTYWATYAGRRTKTAGGNTTGIYFDIKNNFLTAQAAAKAGEQYRDDYNQALNSLLANWERAMAATAINYCHSTIAGLSATTPNYGSALHAHGECVGFLYGFRTVAVKRITDAQIDEVLTLVNAPQYNGAPYRLVNSPVELDKVRQAIARLQAIYGFSDAEIEDFKSNWISVENR